MEKSDKKRLRAQFKADERSQLETSIPMALPILKALLSFLGRPDAPNCDHTLRKALQFMNEHNLDPDKIVPWLREHGGYCDCEIIYNVYNDVGDIVGWHLDDA
jgi:Protein of unknown function (DUF2695)